MSYTEEHKFEILKVFNLSSGQKNPFRRFVILTQQIGEIADGIEYMTAYPDDKMGYKAFLKTGLADSFCQLFSIAELYNFNIQELFDLGISRLKEFRLKGNFKE